VFAGPFPETMPNLLDMPPTAPGEAGLIFHYEPGRQISKDLVSKTPWTQTYTGTNRTRINSAGLLETIGADTPVIDHIGASLEPALRLEPATANILLGTPPVTQDLTLGVGSFTLQVSGAGTAEAAAGTATITGAGTASDGTPVTFAVTAGGTVTITITTATVVWLCPGNIPSSYFAGAAAIGTELVTDGGFTAVTETNSYTSDFSVGADSWVALNGAVAGNIDAIGGYNDVLRFTLNNTENQHYIQSDITNIGKCYKLAFEYYIPFGQSNVDGIQLGSGINTDIGGVQSVTDTWTAVSFYWVADSNVIVTGTDGGVKSFTDAGGDDVFYIKNFTVDIITFTSWTAGTGWEPQATAGALTGKAQKVAGTASDLTQTGTPAEAGKVYRVGHTAVRTAGTLTPEFGSTDGAVISANGTYYDYPIAADTDYIKFKADASFAGSVDVATVKEHGTVRLSEANTTTLAIPADVATALAATGTIVIKGRFAFARAAGVVTNILASAAATNSLVYTTTAAGNITSNDGTTIAENTGAYTANTDWKIALKFPSDTDKYRIGIDVAGAGIAWGTEVAFDGAFTATANLILGYVLHGATWIKYIKIYDKVLTDAQINAL